MFLINSVRLRSSYRVINGSVWLNTRENHPAPRRPAVVPLAEQTTVSQLGGRGGKDAAMKSTIKLKTAG